MASSAPSRMSLPVGTFALTMPNRLIIYERAGHGHGNACRIEPADQIPTKLVGTAAGAKRVDTYLDQIEYGVYIKRVM